MNVVLSVVKKSKSEGTVIYEKLQYLQPSLKRGNGEQSEILLLLGVTHQVNIDQLLHLQGGEVKG